MAAVKKQFGDPRGKRGPVGGDTPKHPPITRWDYDGFVVIFEKDRVVDAVVPGSPPRLHTTAGLTRASNAPPPPDMPPPPAPQAPMETPATQAPAAEAPVPEAPAEQPAAPMEPTAEATPADSVPAGGAPPDAPPAEAVPTEAPPAEAPPPSAPAPQSYSDPMQYPDDQPPTPK